MNSFAVVRAVLIAGFALIITGLGIGFILFAQNQNVLSYIGAVPGILTEVIAGWFFALHNRTSQQRNSYHSNLIAAQNVLLAFKIVEDTKDDDARNKLVDRLLDHLLSKEVISTTSEEVHTNNGNKH